MRVRALDETVSELRTNSELEQVRLKNEVNILKESLERSICDRNSVGYRLKRAESELSSFTELCLNLERETETLKAENGVKILELRLQNEKLFKDLKEKEEEVLTVSEMLQISGLQTFS